MTTRPETHDTTPMTPQQYGVGARFTLSPCDSDFIRIIMDALAAADTTGLEIQTGDISTFVGGTEQRVLEYLSDVLAAAAATGVHLTASVLLSRGCPGELECALPDGVAALGAEPVQLKHTGQRARVHWSLYPLLDGTPTGTSAETVDHMTPIYQAIEQAKAAGVYAGSDHFATRLDGDIASVLETIGNAWIDVGAAVQHVVTHATFSINSPSPIND